MAYFTTGASDLKMDDILTVGNCFSYPKLPSKNRLFLVIATIIALKYRQNRQKLSFANISSILRLYEKNIDLVIVKNEKFITLEKLQKS